jgi:hypothetical protein
MAKLYRYTGEFPPTDVVDRFANWDYALDEETEDGQDETTIRPEDQQSYISEWTAFTAADVFLPSEKQLVALLELVAGQFTGLNVFDPPHRWRLVFDLANKTWQRFVEDWLPEADRSPSVSLEDANVFPLRIITRLPLGKGGKTWQAVIDSNGSQLDV